MSQCRTCTKVEDTSKWHHLIPHDGNEEIIEFIRQLKQWNIVIEEEQTEQKICDDCYSSAVFVRTFRDICVESNKMLLQGATNIVIEENIGKIAEEYIYEDFNVIEEDNCGDLVSEEFSELLMEESEIQQEVIEENYQISYEEASKAHTFIETDVGEEEEVEEADKCEEEVQVITDEEIDDQATSEVIPIEQAVMKVMQTIQNKLTKRTKIPPNPLICHLCISNRSIDLLYKNKADLEAHQLLEHTDSKNLIKCVLCARYFNNRKQCFKHFIEHDKLGEVCPICGKFFGHIFLHLRTTHNKRDFTCEKCGILMENITKQRFEHHQKWHDPDKQLKCPFDGCARTFLQKPHLKMHIATHTGVTEFRCNACEKNFSTALTLKEHFIRKHGAQSDIKCKICYEVFVSSKERNIHIRQVHPEEFSEKCDICQNTFQNVAALRYHVRYVHDMRRKKEPQVLLGRDRKGRIMHGFYRCELCEQQFHSESTLHRHEQIHTSEGRPFACTECPSFYKSASNLRSHMQHFHTLHDDMQHICQFCDKRFAGGYELNSHLMSHNTEKFNCDQCKGSFASERYLKQHQAAKHIIIKKFKCDYCEMKFVDRKRAIGHMKKQHDDLYFKNIY